MKTDTLKIASLTGLIAIAPFAVFAQLGVGDQLGTTEEAIRAALQSAGYEVVEIEFEDDEIEADVILDGQAFEIEIASDGTVSDVEAEEEDEDEDEDDDDT